MSLQQELHRAHKERLLRMRPKPKPEVQPDPVVVEAAPACAPDPVQSWVDRQLNIMPEIPFPAKSEYQIVQAAICHHFGMGKRDLVSKSKTARLAYARQIGMYLVRKYYPHRSFPEIGQRFGGRDHTTAIHSFQKIDALVSKGDGQTIADVRAIEALIQ